MRVDLRQGPFDPWLELQSYQARAFRGDTGVGATATFIGTMRDFNEGDRVQRLYLEHYPGMTEAYLEKVSTEANSRWEILDTLIVHRVGAIEPGDPIVLVAVWSVHRAAAFDACRYLMEELKSRAPFWKQETLGSGQRWVEHNTPG